MACTYPLEKPKEPNRTETIWLTTPPLEDLTRVFSTYSRTKCIFSWCFQVCRYPRETQNRSGKLKLIYLSKDISATELLRSSLTASVLLTALSGYTLQLDHHTLGVSGKRQLRAPRCNYTIHTILQWTSS